MRQASTYLAVTAALGILVWSPTAQAQNTTVVVGTCGTASYATTASSGARQYPTQDTTGTACTAGGGGGGGGAVTIADGADVAQGTTTDAACATDNGTCTVEAVVKRIAQRLTTINTTLGTPMQATGGTVGLVAGSAVIGHVIVDTAPTTAVTQSGTWTVQPGNTANTTAWKVDGSAVTQPVSGTVTANAGTNLNTSALALDATAGTTNTDIGALGSTTCSTDTGSCNVNAKLSRLAQNLTTLNTTVGSSVTGYAQGSTTAAQLGPLQQVAATTSAPTYTTATTNPQSVDVHGGARTLLQDTAGTPVDYTTTSPVSQIGPYPGLNTSGVVTAATPETCSSGNVANATVACTLATASAKTTYISGFAMTADGATVGLAVSCTLTGTITGTMTFTFAYPAGVAVAGSPLVVQFSPAIPASATNTTIVASCPASGAGGTNAAMSAWGFQL